jgi:hypothetical protein
MRMPIKFHLNGVDHANRKEELVGELKAPPNKTPERHVEDTYSEGIEVSYIITAQFVLQ